MYQQRDLFLTQFEINDYISLQYKRNTLLRRKAAATTVYGIYIYIYINTKYTYYCLF